MQALLAGGRMPTYQDVGTPGLLMIECIVLEAMRILPPAYMVGRCCKTDVFLGGAYLPQGTTVLISPYLMHRCVAPGCRRVRFPAPCACIATLGAYPGGVDCRVPRLTVCRDGRYWERPQDFVPERWAAVLDASPQGAAGVAMRGMGPNGAYIPFGAGPRNCIGAGFALMEVTLVLAFVLSRYRLRLPRGGRRTRPQPLITLRPNGVELEVQPREDAF